VENEPASEMAEPSNLPPNGIFDLNYCSKMAKVSSFPTGLFELMLDLVLSAVYGVSLADS